MFVNLNSRYSLNPYLGHNNKISSPEMNMKVIGLHMKLITTMKKNDKENYFSLDFFSLNFRRNLGKVGLRWRRMA